jgi:hypothetical protein
MRNLTRAPTMDTSRIAHERSASGHVRPLHRRRSSQSDATVSTLFSFRDERPAADKCHSARFIVLRSTIATTVTTTQALCAQPASLSLQASQPRRHHPGCPPAVPSAITATATTRPGGARAAPANPIPPAAHPAPLAGTIPNIARRETRPRHSVDIFPTPDARVLRPVVVERRRCVSQRLD